MVSVTVRMSCTSIATNLTVSGMSSGSIFLPILSAVGRFTSWVDASVTLSRKSSSDIRTTVPGPYSPVWIASTMTASEYPWITGSMSSPPTASWKQSTSGRPRSSMAWDTLSPTASSHIIGLPSPTTAILPLPAMTGMSRSAHITEAQGAYHHVVRYPCVQIRLQSSQTINGRPVTSRQLEALLAVQETGSQTAAARKLGISVPVLHKYISNIEEAAGSPILRTTPSGSRLTEAGEEVASAARAMMWRCDTERGFTVCGSPVTEDLILSVLSALRIPGANVVISDDEYNIRMLREDRADIAIIDDPLYLFDAEEFEMDEIGYMGMVLVDNGPVFIRYRYGAQRVAYMYLDSEGREYTVDSETMSLPELLGSNKSFFVDEYLLTRRNLRLKSAVDPKMLRHAITALYRTEGRNEARLIAALKSRLS